MALTIPDEIFIYNKKNHRLGPDKILMIKMAYIIGLIVWTITVCMLGLYSHDVICTALMFIPYIIFIVSMFNAPYITKSTEKYFFSYDYLSVGLLIFLPLMSWMNINNKSSHPMFITIVIVVVMIIVFL